MPEIHILHVHPDPKVPVRRRKFKYSCEGEDCIAVGAQHLKVGFGGPWTVSGLPAAWPVIFDGRKLDNPFDTGLTVNVNNACDRHGKKTYVLVYDYIKSQYSVNAYAYKSYRNGNAGSVTPYEGYAVFPHIIYYVDGKPIWRTELDITKNGNYAGAGRAVNYRGSAGPAGMALDYKRMKGWYTKINISYKTESRVMIGKQRTTGGVIRQTRYYQDGYNEDETPKMVPYIITGPSVSFSEIVSDISVAMVAVEPGPPGPTAGGTVVVTTWHGEGYVVGAQIFSMNYGPVNNNLGGAIGLTRCSFWSTPTTHSLFAFVKKGSLLLMGTGTATVAPFQVTEAVINLEEMYQTDIDVYAVVEVEYRDDSGNLQTGYGNIDLDMKITYPAMAGVVGPAALQEVVTRSVGSLRGCIGTQLSVIEMTMGGGWRGPGIPRAMGFVTHTGFGGKFVILPYVVERVKTTKGWITLSQYNNLVAKFGTKGISAFTAAGTRLLGTMVVSGEGVNQAVAEFTIEGEEEPEEPELDPDEPEPPEKEKDPRNDKPYDDKHDHDDDDDGPGPGPVIPYTKCVVTINPDTEDVEDPLPIPGPKPEDPGPGPDDPVEESIGYILESQAMVLGTTHPKVCRLYSISGPCSGFVDDILEIGFTRNTFDIGGFTYKSQAPLGVLCLNDCGEAIEGHAAIIDANTFTIRVGAPEGSRYVLMGEFDSHEIPPSTGNLIIRLDPAISGNIGIYANNVLVGSGTGPIFEMDIIPGVYEIRVSADYYNGNIVNATVLGGETTDITVKLTPMEIKKKFISFNVISNHFGADVWINGKKYAVKTPFNIGFQINGLTRFDFRAEKLINGITYSSPTQVVYMDMNSPSTYTVKLMIMMFATGEIPDWG